MLSSRFHVIFHRNLVDYIINTNCLLFQIILTNSKIIIFPAAYSITNVSLYISFRKNIILLFGNFHYGRRETGAKTFFFHNFHWYKTFLTHNFSMVFVVTQRYYFITDCYHFVQLRFIIHTVGRLLLVILVALQCMCSHKSLSTSCRDLSIISSKL